LVGTRSFTVIEPVHCVYCCLLPSTRSTLATPVPFRLAKTGKPVEYRSKFFFV
jgi:hypothetical protein